MANQYHKSIKSNLAFYVLVLSIIGALIISFIPIGVGYNYAYDTYFAIASSHHISLGGVIPPLNAYLIFLISSLFGYDVFSYQIYTFLIITSLLYLLYLINNKLNGDWKTLLITLCVAFPYIYLTYRINYAETTKVFWLLTIYFYINLVEKHQPKYLLWLGLITGFAILNKWDIFWLDLSLLITLLISKERVLLFNKYLPCSFLLMLIIISPYLWWMIQNGFINVLYYFQYDGNYHLTFYHFYHVLSVMGVIFIPLIIIGILFYVFSQKNFIYRHLGIASIMLILLIWITNAPIYFLYPYAFVLFIGIGLFVVNLQSTYLFLVSCFYIFLIFMINICQMFLNNNPLMNKHTVDGIMKSHQSLIYFINQGLGIDINGFQYNVGAKALAKEVKKYYQPLSYHYPHLVIWAESYVYASMIGFYSKKYNLPYPISSDQDWYFWGTKDATSSSTFLYIGSLNFVASLPKLHKISLSQYFNSIKKVGEIRIAGASHTLAKVDVWRLSGWKNKQKTFKENWINFANMSQHK